MTDKDNCGNNLQTNNTKLPSNRENKTDDNNNLEEKLKCWRLEQHRIASAVIVRDDPQAPPAVTIYSSDRYNFIEVEPNNHSLYGGVDVSFPENDDDLAVAVYVIVRNDEKKTLIYRDEVYFELKVPYVSSYLSFREIEPLEHLVKKQMVDRPDITPHTILVDGNGILHARRAGIACFLGVETGIRTIGVGKTLYCQGGLSKEGVKSGVEESVNELYRRCVNGDLNALIRDKTGEGKRRVMVMDQQCIEAGAPSLSENTTSTTREEMTNMIQYLSQYFNGIVIKLRGDDGTVWGAALLCHGGGAVKKRVGWSGTKNPIYISVGHDISLQEATQICCDVSLARIPEPVRMADLEGRRLLREAPSSSPSTVNEFKLVKTTEELGLMPSLMTGTKETKKVDDGTSSPAAKTSCAATVAYEK